VKGPNWVVIRYLLSVIWESAQGAVGGQMQNPLGCSSKDSIFAEILDRCLPDLQKLKVVMVQSLHVLFY